MSGQFVFDGDKLKEVTGQPTPERPDPPHHHIKSNKFTLPRKPHAQKREVCGGDFEATIDRTSSGTTVSPMVSLRTCAPGPAMEAVKQTCNHWQVRKDRVVAARPFGTPPALPGIKRVLPGSHGCSIKKNLCLVNSMQ